MHNSAIRNLSDEVLNKPTKNFVGTNFFVGLYYE